MVVNLAILAFAAYFGFAGFAILAQREALIRRLRLGEMSRSAFNGVVLLALGVFALVMLVIRLGSNI